MCLAALLAGDRAVTGPASTLAHQFAQVRNGLKHRQRGTGSTRNTEPALAALSVIEQHLQDMRAALEPVLDAFEDHLEDKPCDGCEDLVVRARAALSVGEERSETRG